MAGDYHFDFVTPLISLGALAGLSIWGFVEIVDWLFIDDAIRVESPIDPEIELVIKNNQVDTIYIYREP